ncbi:periphilin-1 isoform X1 [Cricetulus griseus]|uniref:Periphilin-1 isoform X1 n=1 Tax=Cricetulus griseus TaxID=10029 RepID=A0A9J7GJ93_CRIGR|nr:periphilin-1 isoform X1 [Cricetulus griseus]
MWSKGRYDYKRLPRERSPSWSHVSDGYHRVANDVPKRPPLRDKRAPSPPVLDMRPPKLARHDEEGYSRVDYGECDKGHRFSHDPRRGSPHKGDDSGYRRSRGHHFTRQKSEYRNMRDAFRRKSFYSSQYSRDRSPHKRDAPFFRESPVGQKDAPHRRSGSSLSSRSYSPEGSKTSSFHQSQYTSKEKSIQSSKTSGDTSPSRSSEVSSSKVLDQPSWLTEKELAEDASKWDKGKPEKADENTSIDSSEFETGSTGPVFIDQTEEPESNTTDGTELCKDSQLSSRSKAIASKTKEIQQAYRQDFETFGMVVKMLVDKEPSLEKSIQFALRQNLQEMGERCVEELKRFITEYDNSTQDSGDRF